MTNPVYIDWAKDNTSLPTQLNLEKEASFDEVYKESKWKKKILMRLIKLFGYTPQLAFQKEDVNLEIVDEMLKHPELLKAVDQWISETDYGLLDKLKEAKEVFEKIQPPANHQALYRGFTINVGQQNSGLTEHYKKSQPGFKWSYVPEKPMSFSWHKGTTTVYGNIIVSAGYQKIASRCLHITHEMIMAMFKMDDENWDPEENFYMFTYAESVFLPDGKPIEFTLVSKG